MADVPFAPTVGQASVTGHAPTVDRVDSWFPLGAWAERYEVGAYALFPSAGAATLTGHAPSISFSQVLTPASGSAGIAGYAPTVLVNHIFTPAATDLAATGQAPVVIQGDYVSLTAGAATVTGHAPAVNRDYTITPATGSLVAAGQDLFAIRPDVVAVTFPFLASAQGFTGTPGAGTTMAWTGTDGNPLGSLQTRTTGSSRSATNTWTLTTDFISLGVPANKVVTAILAKSAQSRCTEYTVGAASSVAAVTLTPTGYPTITIAAGRSFSAADGSWQTSTSADSTGLAIPSGSSLEITLGSTLATGANVSAAVTLRQDNIAFTILYTDVLRLDAAVGAVSVTGYAPTVATTETIVAANSWFPRLTEGANTWEERFYGGDDAGFALTEGTLSLEGFAPTIDFGNPTFTPEAASLGIEGYELDFVGPPITVAGADYLNSEPATVEATSVRVITLGDKRLTPTVAAATITGYAPTVNLSYGPTPTRGQGTIAGYAPAVARDYTIAVPASTLTVTGRVPAAPLASPTITPTAGALGITGYALTFGERPLAEPTVGSARITGRAPLVSVNTPYPQTAGAAEITGYAPTLAETTQPYQTQGAATITGYAPTITAARLLTVTAALASQPATTTSTETVKRRGSGALQSAQPLAFSGTGIRRLIGSGTLQSGPASLAGDVVVIDVVLVSEPATMFGRGRIIGYTPPRPRPERVNRYNVVLKPNKRLRVKRPNQRKPTR